MAECEQITRRADWRARLAEYVAACALRPFRPGTHDCALFAAGAVEAMTGRDLAEGWRGAYRSLQAGREALAAAGFEAPADLAALHFQEVPPAFAAVGDLALLAGADGAPAFGVVQGPNVYCLRPAGLAAAPRSEIQRAFRV